MSKIPSPHFQMESWAIVFSIFSLINFGIVYIWPKYESLNNRIWCTIHFFFIPKRVALCSKYWLFLAWAPTSICHLFCLSVYRASYLRNRTSSNHSFWYKCVNDISRCFLFLFFEVLIFWAVRGKREKIAQNKKLQLHLSHAISQEQYSIWSGFLVHLCKMMIPPGGFFWELLGQ